MGRSHGGNAMAAYVFLDVALVVVLARLTGALFRRLRQPAVVGEIVAGILLGPTFLGGVPLGGGRHLGTTLFPPEVRPMLTTLANLGLVVFMFIVGLELNLGLVRGNGRRAGGVSLASVAVPFALGVGLAGVLFPAHRTGTTFPAFALFVGASMSVTAFPVLARILTERGMHRTPLGVLALAAAAVDDVLAWSLLAAVTAVAEHGGRGQLEVTVGASLAFVAGMLLVVRPLLRGVTARYRRAGRLTPDLLAVLLAGLLLSAYATEKIGIHFIFGAFLFGAAVPREGSAPMVAEILERLEQVSVLLLLPLFFVTTGFTVDLRGTGRSGLGELGLILLVACAGKFLGASGAARAQGLPGRTSAALGVLMNTRGLTELVILRIGLDKNVLDADLFALLVVMAVVTTVITEPLLRVVYPDRLVARDVAAAERARLGPAAYRLVVAVDDPARAARLAGLAAALVRGRGPAEVLLSHLRPVPRAPVELGSGLVGELAEVAAALEALNAAAAGLRGQRVEPVVLARSSADVPADLLTHVRTVEADLVVVDADADRGLVERLLADAPCTVLVVRAAADRPAGDGGAVLLVGGGRHDEAAVEVARRLAAGRPLSVAVVPLDGPAARRAARRAGTLAERLRRLGVAAAVRPGAAGDGPPDAGPPAPGLVVAPLRDGWAADLAGARAAAGDPPLAVLVRAAPDAGGGKPDRAPGPAAGATVTTTRGGQRR